MTHRTVAFCAGAALSAASAFAQTFTNPDFEGGTLAGWTVVNTANGVGAPGSVSSVDIDGPGPLNATQAATFMVGQASFVSGEQQGIEMTQTLALTAGTPYTFAFDWAAVRDPSTTGANAEGGVFSLIVDGTAIMTQAAGTVTNTTPVYGHLSVVYTPATSGNSSVGVRITRPYLVPGNVTEYVDNFLPGGGGPPSCYANCDGSTGANFLNVNDFVCFQSAFAAGSSLANCDHSTGANPLNINDFVCFQSAFAAGCSAP